MSLAWEGVDVASETSIPGTMFIYIYMLCGIRRTIGSMLCNTSELEERDQLMMRTGHQWDARRR